MIANKTTTVPAEKTIMEIQQMLATARAAHIMTAYQDGKPDAIAFQLQRGGESLSFRLPVNWKGLLAAMRAEKKTPRSLLTEDQARRVSWRVLREWLRAQLTLIEAGAATIEEVMLPWAITSDGTTVGQRMLNGERGFLALPSPTKS